MLEADLANPYSPGPMVTESAMFFGREEEIKYILSNLRKMGSTSVVGMRRIGKSSLLYNIAKFQELGKNHTYLVAYIDLQNAEYYTRKGLLNGVIRQWNSKIMRPMQEITNLSDFSGIVRNLVSEGWMPVICLDEFENIVRRRDEFGDEVFESWRSLSNERKLAFITASKLPLSNLIKQNQLTSNFDNVFVQLTLGLLTEGSATELLDEPFKRLRFNLRDDIRSELLGNCGYHPFFLQLGGFHIFETIQQKGKDVNEFILDLKHLFFPHFVNLWEGLPVDRQVALFAIVGKAFTSEKSKSELRNLERLGLVIKVNNGYEPFCRLFKDWIIEQSTQQELVKTDILDIQTTADDIEAPQLASTPKWSPLVVYSATFIAILVISALVLKFILNNENFFVLSIFVAIGLTFALVGAGKLTGRDFVDFLKELLSRKNQSS